MDYVIEQVGCFLHCSLDQGFVFDPLGEFINADVDLAETSWHGLERSNHIQSPVCKGPRCRNHLQVLSWDMDLFSKKLAVLTSADKCFGITYG